MNSDRLRQTVNGLAAAGALAVNILANALPINGQATGAISDRFQVYFVPAGYVFAIWGVIYLGWIGFVVYQALPGQGSNPRLRRIGYLFALSCVANAGWLLLWHYEQFVASVVVMFTLLGLLIAIYVRLDVGRANVPPGERWLVHLLFSVYLGWITVATIANVTATLDYLNWNGWGVSDEAWTAVMLAVSVVLGAAMTVTRRDAAYLLVLIWAVVGIAVKHAAVAPVSLAAWVAAGLLVGLLVATRLPKLSARFRAA